MTFLLPVLRHVIQLSGKMADDDQPVLKGPFVRELAIKALDSVLNNCDNEDTQKLLLLFISQHKNHCKLHCFYVNFT